MSIKLQILKFLIQNKERTFSMNEISKLLKIDYKLVHTNIKKLEEKRSIEVVDQKSQKRCSFKNDFNEDVFNVEYERRNILLEKKEFEAIYNKLKIINSQFILLLFGSHAKGTNTNSSDVDLLLICEEQTEKQIKEKLGTLPLDIHQTHISYKSFKEMLKSKELTVISEALKNNIILFGIEDYYRLLENAK